MGNRSAITDARARTFKVPPGREAVLWDGVVSGLGVRALPSGRKSLTRNFMLNNNALRGAA